MKRKNKIYLVHHCYDSFEHQLEAFITKAAANKFAKQILAEYDADFKSFEELAESSGGDEWIEVKTITLRGTK